MFINDSTRWKFFVTAMVLTAVTAVSLAALFGIARLFTEFIGDPVAAAILTGVAPIIATSSLSVWNEFRQQSQTRELEQIRRRSEAYQGLLSFLYEAIHQLDDPTSPDKLVLDTDEYGDFVQDILTWGSDELIETWNEFREVEFDRLQRPQQRAWYGRLLEQIRTELRGSETDATPDELYDLYSTESTSDDEKDS